MQPYHPLKNFNSFSADLNHINKKQITRANWQPTEIEFARELILSYKEMGSKIDWETVKNKINQKFDQDYTQAQVYRLKYRIKGTNEKNKNKLILDEKDRVNTKKVLNALPPNPFNQNLSPIIPLTSHSSALSNLKPMAPVPSKMAISHLLNDEKN